MLAKRNLVFAAVGAAIAAVCLIPLLIGKNRELSELRSRMAGGSPATEAAGSAGSPSGLPGRAGGTGRGGANDRAEQAKQRRRNLERGRPWAEAVQQIGDAAEKQAGLDAIYEALGSDDIDDVRAGFAAWRAVGSVEFDRAPFRTLIESLLEHDNGEIRASALGTLPGLPKDPADYAKTVDMATDPDEAVRRVVVSNLFWLGGRDLTGEGGEVALGF